MSAELQLQGSQPHAAALQTQVLIIAFHDIYGRCTGHKVKHSGQATKGCCMEPHPASGSGRSAGRGRGRPGGRPPRSQAGCAARAAPPPPQGAPGSGCSRGRRGALAWARRSALPRVERVREARACSPSPAPPDTAAHASPRVHAPARRAFRTIPAGAAHASHSPPQVPHLPPPMKSSLPASSGVTAYRAALSCLGSCVPPTSNVSSCDWMGAHLDTALQTLACRPSSACNAERSLQQKGHASSARQQRGTPLHLLPLGWIIGSRAAGPPRLRCQPPKARNLRQPQSGVRKCVPKRQ